MPRDYSAAGQQNLHSSKNLPLFAQNWHDAVPSGDPEIITNKYHPLAWIKGTVFSHYEEGLEGVENYFIHFTDGKENARVRFDSMHEAYNTNLGLHQYSGAYTFLWDEKGITPKDTPANYTFIGDPESNLILFHHSSDHELYVKEGSLENLGIETVSSLPKVLKDFEVAANSGDVRKLSKMFGQEASMKDPVSMNFVHGFDQIMTRCKHFYDGTPSLKIGVKDWKEMNTPMQKAPIYAVDAAFSWPDVDGQQMVMPVNITLIEGTDKKISHVHCSSQKAPALELVH